MDARFDEALAARAAARSEPAGSELVDTPILAALRAAGTEHVYGDTADLHELRELVVVGERGLRREIDGNTANQPLVRRVVGRYLDEDPRGWSQLIAAHGAGIPRSELLPLLYAALCGRIGNDLACAFSLTRNWEVSLQLHMGLVADPDAARRVGHLLRRMVPSVLVKVPFAPDAPHCFLVARDLERAGIAVNFTSTFSARQAVAAALLANVTRTNVFMGRLNQGLEAERLGEHVDLEAQRALRRLREEDGVQTRLIVASMHDWRSFCAVAGCDVFTAPCKVLRDLLRQDEVAPDEIVSRLETSYEDALGVSARVLDRLGADRIARLYRVEPELVEFLRSVRDAPDYGRMDGDALHRRFEAGGFADLFHAPTAAEREELARGKLPDLDGALAGRIPLDTHFSLLANADFARAQREIDEEIEKRLDATS